MLQNCSREDLWHMCFRRNTCMCVCVHKSFVTWNSIWLPLSLWEIKHLDYLLQFIADIQIIIGVDNIPLEHQCPSFKPLYRISVICWETGKGTTFHNYNCFFLNNSLSLKQKFIFLTATWKLCDTSSVISNTLRYTFFFSHFLTGLSVNASNKMIQGKFVYSHMKSDIQL